MGKVRTVSSHDQKRLMELNGVLISKRKSNLLVAMEIMRVGGRKGAGWLSRVGDKRTAESRRVGVGGWGRGFISYGVYRPSAQGALATFMPR